MPKLLEVSKLVTPPGFCTFPKVKVTVRPEDPAVNGSVKPAFAVLFTAIVEPSDLPPAPPGSATSLDVNAIASVIDVGAIVAER